MITRERMKNVKTKFIAAALILMLTIGLFFQGSVFAQEKVSVEDKAVGSIFKGLAKTYVTVTDINKLKKNNIDELNKMDAERFQKRYAGIYAVIKDWPPALKNKYKVTADMTKDQAIKNIESVNKEKICEMIDSTPDTIIAKRFKKYMDENNRGAQKSSLPEQVNRFWNKISVKFNPPAPKVK